MNCSICGNPIPVEFGHWALGHNAQPINNGRCCAICQETDVMPARLEMIRKMKEEKKDE